MFRLQPGFTSKIEVSGASIQVCDAELSEKGGVIINPLHPLDQGLAVAESLFVSLFGPAANNATPDTSELVPGQWFVVPQGMNAWVNAASAGHKFTAFFSTTYTVPPPITVPGDPATDVPGLASEAGTQNYPPIRVTGLTTVIPSYLYQQYTDDDDLQGFVEAQNILQQDYVDTFNALNLPIYPGPIVSDKLLDWVGRGVYGMSRPVIGSGKMNLMGPLNTFGPNWLVPMWEFPNLRFDQGNWSVAANTPDISPTAIQLFDGYYWNAVTANPSIPETAPSFLPGIGGNLISSGDKILWDATNEIYIQTVSAAVEAEFGLNEVGLYGPMNVFLTNDDTYRRILTWHFFKHDGNYFSVEFLKRRIWRFLYGVNGRGWDFLNTETGMARQASTWPGEIAELDNAFIADTRQISITFGVHRNVTIRFVLGNRPVTGGAMLNWMGCNGFEPAFGVVPPWDIGTDTTRMPTGIRPPGGIYMNDLETTYEIYPPLPFMYIFKEALDLGVLEVPYQFNFTCHIG